MKRKRVRKTSERGMVVSDFHTVINGKNYRINTVVVGKIITTVVPMKKSEVRDMWYGHPVAGVKQQ